MSSTSTTGSASDSPCLQPSAVEVHDLPASDFMEHDGPCHIANESEQGPSVMNLAEWWASTPTRPVWDIVAESPPATTFMNARTASTPQATPASRSAHGDGSRRLSIDTITAHWHRLKAHYEDVLTKPEARARYQRTGLSSNYPPIGLDGHKLTAVLALCKVSCSCIYICVYISPKYVQALWLTSASDLQHA